MIGVSSLQVGTSMEKRAVGVIDILLLVQVRSEEIVFPVSSFI